MLTIKGDMAVTVGDRHAEDVYRGSHINYQENIYRLQDELNEIVEKGGYDLFVETGDFVGVRNGVSMLESHIMRYKLIDHFNKMKCEKVVNTGNHDLFGEDLINDYLFLNRLGIYYTPANIADTGSKIGVVKMISKKFTDDDGKPLEMYIHIVPYGQEFEQLKPVKNSTNIAITHNDFRIGGKNFTNNDEAIDLTTHEPFFGMDVILNGHIHTPSEPTTYTTTAGSQGIFINVGSPARPKRNEDYNAVWYVEYGFVMNELTGKAEPQVTPRLWRLKPANEIFREGTSKDNALKEIKDEIAEFELANVFDSLQDFNWAGVSLPERINLLSIEEPVKDIMFDYMGISKSARKIYKEK